MGEDEGKCLGDGKVKVKEVERLKESGSSTCAVLERGERAQEVQSSGKAARTGKGRPYRR